MHAVSRGACSKAHKSLADGRNQEDGWCSAKSACEAAGPGRGAGYASTSIDVPSTGPENVVDLALELRRNGLAEGGQCSPFPIHARADG